jgi:hypothetical protein
MMLGADMSMLVRGFDNSGASLGRSSSAVRARTQAFNGLFDALIIAPSPMHDELVSLSKRIS